MSTIYYIGLDVHKDSVAVVIAPSDSTEIRKYGVIDGARRLGKLTKKFTQPDVELRLVYEAGRDYGRNRVIQSRDREGALNISRALERERRDHGSHGPSCKTQPDKMAYNLKRVLNLVTLQNLIAAVS